MPDAIARLPFQEQIDFFQQKTDLPTRAWTDIYLQEHDRAFVVAGAMKEALIRDLREAVAGGIRDGQSLEWFRQRFDEIVERHGWRYNGGRGWRTRVIYETNLYTSYAAGRLRQMREIADERPYWTYRHSDWVRYPRPQHVAWDGLTLRHDDPWWRTHYPPNGWGCKCYVETQSEDGLRRLGKTGPDTAPPIEWETKTIGVRGPSPRTVRVPRGIDPGFEYQPGRTWLDGMTPPPRTTPPPLPPAVPPAPRPVAPAPERPAPAPQPQPAPERAPAPPRQPAPERPAPAPQPRPEPPPPRPPVITPADGRALLDALGARDEPKVLDLPGVGPLVVGPSLMPDGGPAPDALTAMGNAILDPDLTLFYIEWPAGAAAGEVRKRLLRHLLIDGEPATAVFDFGPSGWWASLLEAGAWPVLGAVAWEREQ